MRREADPKEELVTMLERQLKLAREGQLQGAFLIGFFDGGMSVIAALPGDFEPGKIVASLAQAQFDVLHFGYEVAEKRRLNERGN